MFAKIIRAFRNPSTYISLAWYRYVQKRLAWPILIQLYRRIYLPINQKRVARKDRITVLFLAMSVAYWKYDAIYRRMAADRRFKPIIMPAMRTNQPIDDQVEEHEQLMVEFSRRGYNVAPGYDKSRKKFINPKYLKPDVVFYTHPYSGPGRLRRMYDFWAMRKALICYATYFFPIGGDAHLFNNPIQNLAWQVYYAYDAMRLKLSTMMNNHGINVKISGYSLGEELSEVSIVDSEAAWKSDKRRRIIWAPHHSIDDDSGFRTSTFRIYAEYMRELAVEYRDKIFFTFKPHPVLYSRLVKSWGRERTDEYYDFWRKQENTQLQEGGYLALFKGSDALIHDCGSFQSEYLYLNKPCMFLYRPDFVELPNQTGVDALNAHYSGRSKGDIVKFIDDVVMGGEDCLEPKRRDFFKTYLESPNGRTFSENVINEILCGLGKA